MSGRRPESHQADYFAGADQEIQTDWFKIPLLREAETVVRLGIRS